MKANKLISVILCIAMVMSTMSFNVFATDEPVPSEEIEYGFNIPTAISEVAWYNDEATEFTLSDAVELKEFAQLVNEGNTFQNKTVKLGNDIDLENTEWTPIGYLGKSFKGTFDGQNHTISNLNFIGTQTNAANNNSVGLFGKIESPALIQNLTVENATISGSLNVGVIVGLGSTGKGIINCHVKGDVKVDAWWYAGVIGGYGYTSPIEDCTVKVNDGSYVKGNEGSYIGGIWGFRGEGGMVIENCSVENIKISGVDRVGGITGMAHFGNTISECAVANTTISASDAGCTSVGLIAGANNGTTSQPSVIVNNTVEESVKADVAGEPVTSTTGGTNTNGVTEATVVGTDVVFDESGKITEGKFEVEPASSKLADDFVATKNDDGSYGVELGNQIYIGSEKYDTLAEAIDAASGETVLTLSAGTYTMPNVSNKTITFEGSKNAVIDMSAGATTTGSTLTFNGVTIKYGNANYKGLYHATKVVYNNCTQYGTQFLYAPTVEFNGCTFEMNDEKTEYSVWTYGAKDVTFTDCVFNTNGKAVLVYTEGAHEADIAVAGCEFNSNGTFTGKAAVELGESANGNKATYNLSFEDCTADENFSANNSTSNLWGNKNDMAVADDGNGNLSATTYKATIDTAIYDSLQDAINAAEKGQTVKLFKDVTETGITVAADDDVIIDLNGKTVTGNFWVNGKAEIKNGSIVSADESAIEINSSETADGTKGTFAPELILTDVNTTSARHAIRVDGGKATITGGVHVGGYHGFNISSGATVVIDVESVTGTSSGAAIATRDAETNVTINGGQLLGEHDSLYGQLTVWGGSDVVVNNITCDTISADGTVTINDGKIGEVKKMQNKGINGGTFTVAPSFDYIADGKYPVKSGDTYVIGDAVAEVGGVYYATFDNAWKDAVKAGGAKTIKLIADATHDSGDYSTNMSASNITIDLNGFDLTLNKNLPVGGSFYSGNTLTINNATNIGSVIFNNDSCIEFEADPAGTLVINGGKFVKAEGSAIIQDKAWGTVNQTITINGGDFTDVNSAVLGGKINENDIVTKPATLSVIAPDGYKWENDTTLAKAATVCKIGGTQYETIQAAIDAANAGDEIILFTNQTESGITVAADDDVIINLGGKTVTGDFMVYGKAVIKNGNIVNETAGVSAIENNGASSDLTVIDVNTTSARHAIRVDGGKATITGGVHVGNHHGFNISSGAVAVIDVESVTGTAKGAAINTYGDGTHVTVNGGKLLGEHDPNYAQLAIMGGTAIINDVECEDIATDRAVEIYGGTFGAINHMVGNGIYGGTFGTDPSAYVAEGKEATLVNDVYTINNARKFTVTATPNTVVADDYVDVKITLDGTDLYGCDWELVYDNTLFELVVDEDDEYYDDVMGSYVAPGKTSIPAGYTLATYRFKVRPQYEKKTYEFTLKDATSYTRGESAVNKDVVSDVVAGEPATVTIELDKFDVEVLVDNNAQTGNTAEVDYTAAEHTIKINPTPADAVVTVTVDGNEQTLTDNAFTLTEAKDYEIKYTVSKIGYETYDETFTLTIGAPDYVVEVNLSEEAGADYISGKKIVLVYTNSEVISFNYAGAKMFDVTSKGYKYQNTDEYAKVYALVVDAIDNGELADYEENVKVDFETVTDEYEVTIPQPEHDINYSGAVDIRDVIVAYGVYNEDTFYFANYMNLVLAADVNNDKCVNPVDTTNVTTTYNTTRKAN